jgi:death-on-curing family protein
VTTYLEIENVLQFHADPFGITDQQASDRLRDPDRLQAALARPRQYAFYPEADLSLQAAALAHGIAEGQPFVDGNRRVTLVTPRAFLLVNGIQANASQEERARWILDLHAGLSVEDLAERIREYLIPVE